MNHAVLRRFLFSFLPNLLAFCGEYQYNIFEFTIKVGKYMKENEFDLDFDFEKEYGFDLDQEDKA